MAAAHFLHVRGRPALCSPFVAFAPLHVNAHAPDFPAGNGRCTNEARVRVRVYVYVYVVVQANVTLLLTLLLVFLLLRIIFGLLLLLFSFPSLVPRQFPFDL